MRRRTAVRRLYRPSRVLWADTKEVSNANIVCGQVWRWATRWSYIHVFFLAALAWEGRCRGKKPECRHEIAGTLMIQASSPGLFQFPDTAFLPEEVCRRHQCTYFN